DAVGPEDTMRAILEVEPAPLKLGDLDRVLAKALSKSPADRYQTTVALGHDISRYLAHEPVAARPGSAGYRLARFLRRNRVAVLAGALAVGGLLAATAFSISQMREAERQRDVAVNESRRADAQVEFQHVLLSEIGEKPMTMLEILNAGRRVLETQYAGDDRLMIQLLVQLAMAYDDLHDDQNGWPLIYRAESLAVRLQSMGDLAQVRCEIANKLRLQGKYGEAWTMLESTDSLVEREGTPGQIVDCLGIRAFLASETGKSEESFSAARRAIAIKDSLHETSDANYMNLSDDFATGLSGIGRKREAIEVWQHLIAAMDRSGRGGVLSRAVMRHNMALVLTKMGKTAEAESIFHEAMEVASRTEAEGEINNQPAIHYAETALTQGHTDSAFRYFKMIAEHAVRDSSMYWEGRGLYGLARAEIALGLVREARQAKLRLEQIIARYPHVQDTDDVVPEGETLDGLLALRVGDYTGATASFKAALAGYGFPAKGADRLGVVVMLASRSALLSGKPDESLELARQALSIASVDSLTDRESTRVGEARLLEAKALLAEGDTAAARRSVALARESLRAGAGANHPLTREAEELSKQLP
ncbi:MAG: tetratricopeptide repeat protein, partial [Gemmatimonadota bacterium]